MCDRISNQFYGRWLQFNVDTNWNGIIVIEVISGGVLAPDHDLLQRIALQLNFELQHFPVRQLAGPDRSGNFPHRIDLKHKTIGDGGPPSCDRGQRQRWLVLISSSCWKLWRPPCDRGRFGLGQGCIFRAPIMSWPRIMCSQVRMLKFLQQPREIPYIRVSEGKKTVLSFP